MFAPARPKAFQRPLAVEILFFLAAPAAGQEPYAAELRHFDYDKGAPLN
jgi:hypothetical protein